MNLLSLHHLLGIILGVVVGMSLPEIYYTKTSSSKTTAEDIVNYANKEADNIKKKNYLRQKEENQILREQTESELRERRGNFKDKKPDFFKKKRTWIENLIFR